MRVLSKHIILFLIGINFLLKQAYSQDTIRIDKMIEYNSKTDSIGIIKHFAKNVYYRAEYAKELIKYSLDSFKLELCFYYNKKRYIHYYSQFDYKLSNNSIIKIKYGGLEESWNYKKINDSLYSLNRFYFRTLESGFAKSLIPLEKFGEFITTNLTNDTLWSTKYLFDYFPEIKPYQAIINDSIYDIDCVDVIPEYLEGDTMIIKTLKKNLLYPQKPILDSQLPCNWIFLNFIIDKEGKIKNVGFYRTSCDSFYEQEALRALSKLGRFKAGIKNGMPVNVRMKLPPVRLTFE